MDVADREVKMMSDEWEELSDSESIPSVVKSLVSEVKSLPSQVKRPVTCFFCESINDSVSESADHCLSEHSFDIRSYINERVTSHYDLVKLVTYLRKQKPTTKDLESFSDMKLWSSDDYLCTVNSDDPWLWADNGLVVDEVFAKGLVNNHYKFAHPRTGLVTISQSHYNVMKDLNQLLEELLKKEIKKKDALTKVIAELGVTNTVHQDYYYSSYSSFGIHRQMLNDNQRMSAYLQAIDPLLFKGKLVLDVGSGTGILAMLAASAGATKVVGVDNSNIHDAAVEIIKDNGLQSKVTLIKGEIEKVELNHKFDIIVSEWMGFFLFYERMLESVLIARNKFLKEGGLMVPSNCAIWLAGCCDPEGHRKRTACHVLGYRMEPLRRDALFEPVVEVVSPDFIVTNPTVIHKINTSDPALEPSSCCSFSTDFSLKCKKNCELTSICGWFDCLFRPASGVLFTSPFTASTHWAQTNFYLTQPIQVKAGTSLVGNITVAPESQRGLRITFMLPTIDAKINIKCVECINWVTAHHVETFNSSLGLSSAVEKFLRQKGIYLFGPKLLLGGANFQDVFTGQMSSVNSSMQDYSGVNQEANGQHVSMSSLIILRYKIVKDVLKFFVITANLKSIKLNFLNSNNR